MKQTIEKEIKDHPIMYIIIACLCTAISVFGTTTFATMNYVDKQDRQVKEYVKEKNDDLKKDLDDIKKALATANKNILNIYKEKK